MFPFDAREVSRGAGACNDARSGIDFFARRTDVLLLGERRDGEADVGLRYEDCARESVCDAWRVVGA